MAAFSKGNGETQSKTQDYLLKLKAVGHDSDPYELPKNQWSKDIEMLPGIGFPDIYNVPYFDAGKVHIANVVSISE